MSVTLPILSEDQAEAWDRLSHQLQGMGVDLTAGTITPQAEGKAAVLAVVGTGIQVLRKRSLHHVLTAVVDWHLVLAGIAVGAIQALPRRWAPLPSRCLRLTP